METYAQNRYETAALILGIISLALLFMGLLPFCLICGPLAVILAFLSRGRHRTLSQKGLFGVILGGGSCVIVVVLVCALLILYGSNVTIRDTVNTTLTGMLGIDLTGAGSWTELYELLQEGGTSL